MTRALFLLSFLLASAGCTANAEDFALQTRESTQPTPPIPPEPGAAKADAQGRDGVRSVAVANARFEFEYSWPAEAGAIPALQRRLENEMEEARNELDRATRAERENAREAGYTFRPHSFSSKWEVLADTPRFLVLSSMLATYSGGAHGNYSKRALLWDKRADREIEPLELFTSAEALREATEDRYCAQLNSLRREKGVGVPGEGDPFPRCPPLDNLVLLPGSSDGEKLDRLTLYAAPYTAGSYAEGDYKVTLDVTRAMLDAVKPEYRTAFSLAD